MFTNPNTGNYLKRKTIKAGPRNTENGAPNKILSEMEFMHNYFRL